MTFDEAQSASGSHRNEDGMERVREDVPGDLSTRVVSGPTGGWTYSQRRVGGGQRQGPSPSESEENKSGGQESSATIREKKEKDENK